MSYRETICFASIPARARSGVVCCKAAAALKAPSRSVSSPVYSLVFRCRISLHKATCSSKAALTSFCVIWHPSFEKWIVPDFIYYSGHFRRSADKSSRQGGARILNRTSFRLKSPSERDTLTGRDSIMQSTIPNLWL